MVRKDHRRSADFAMCVRLRVAAICMVAAAGMMVHEPVAGEEPPATPSPEASRALLLLDSDDPYNRKLGFLRLEALREPATADAIRVYVGSRDPDMRADTLRALTAIEGAKVIPLLLEHFKTEKKPRVRWSALLALETFREDHPELLPTFIEALNDYRPEVRMTAVDIVSRIDDPAAHDAIRTRWRKELQPDVRKLLKTAMQRIERP